MVATARLQKDLISLPKQRTVGRSEIAFLSFRYFAALLQALEGVLISWLLGSTSYGKYAFWLQLGTLTTMAGIGSAWGFLLTNYSKRGKAIEASYVLGSATQYLSIGSIIIGVLAAYRSDWAVGGIYFLALVPQMIIETPMRVSDNYNRFALFRCIAPTLSCACVLFGLNEYLARRFGLTLLTGTVLTSAFSYHCANFALIPQFSPAIRYLRERWRYKELKVIYAQYIRQILSVGIGPGLTSLPYLFAYNMDRFFIEKYRSGQSLGNYSLAWLLVQGGALALGSLNLLATVRLGSVLQETNHVYRSRFKQQILLVSFTTGFVFVSLVTLGWLLRIYSHNVYADLPMTMSILCIGQLPLGISSVFVSDAFFKGKSKAINTVLWAATGAIALSNIICAHFANSYRPGILCSALILFFSNTFIIIWCHNQSTDGPRK